MILDSGYKPMEHLSFSKITAIVDSIFKNCGHKGIALSGETGDAWIFKPLLAPDDDIWISLVVSKKDGTIHYLNPVDPDDDKIARTAVIIENYQAKT